jgi:hypothetical protein
MIQDYINRGVQTQTTKLGLTKVRQNLTDPIVDAVNANADVLDSAAIIVAAPGSATATGKAGQIAFDATHIYVCVATDTWVRATLATF